MSDSQAENRPVSGPSERVLDRALDIVQFLRARCPWDAAQTPVSLRRYLLEEAHEVVDAIDRDEPPLIAEELGDLLLNVAFQIVLGEEGGQFTRQQVVDALDDKMRRRHPHLYGAEPADWEEIKAAEKGTTGERDGILSSLVAGADPLAHAHRVQSRVAEVGFDWPDVEGPISKVREEVAEVEAAVHSGSEHEVEEELGDLLFSVVNLSRAIGVHAPTALIRANQKFVRRFRAVEELARARGVAMPGADLQTLDSLWDDVKRDER